MDEFLVSGETIVRNLQAGICAGPPPSAGSWRSGTCPTCSATWPRCRRSSARPGFEHAVVWRGVPSAVDRTAFVWTAPDGSSVRAEYLVAGYGNGAALPEDAKAAGAAARRPSWTSSARSSTPATRCC